MKSVVSKKFIKEQTRKKELKKRIKQFLDNNSPIDNFTNKFFEPRKKDYQQYYPYFSSKIKDFEQNNYKITNGYDQMLFTTLFTKFRIIQNQQKLSQRKCIIYLHGYGSIRLEAINILQVLPDQFDFCCFDFSGSGKSQGQISTFGIKQKEDIHYVINYLKNIGYQKFILWGRSMGATAALLYTTKYKPKEVLIQICDSSFYSFQNISVELVHQKIGIPLVGINLALNFLREKCLVLADINPFLVNLQNISECLTPTIFVYSQRDQIISQSNTQKICEKFKAFYQKLQIKQLHNQPRSYQNLRQIIKKILVFLLKNSKQFLKNHKNRNSIKGIGVSLEKRGQLNLQKYIQNRTFYNNYQYNNQIQTNFSSIKNSCKRLNIKPESFFNEISKKKQSNEIKSKRRGSLSLQKFKYIRNNQRNQSLILGKKSPKEQQKLKHKITQVQNEYFLI